MKRTLIAVAVLAISSFTASSQTKGTSMVGFGITSGKTETERRAPGDYKTEQKSNGYSLSYGYFIKDYSKIEFVVSYDKDTYSSNQTDDESKGYGAGLSYQHYYPLLKKFYAFAGGRASYYYSSSEQQTYPNSNYKNKTNAYSLGAYGGATYFLSKRFAFEAQLLSASFGYVKTKRDEGAETIKGTNLDVSTDGAINNLSFKIYFMF